MQSSHANTARDATIEMRSAAFAITARITTDDLALLQASDDRTTEKRLAFEPGTQRRVDAFVSYTPYPDTVSYADNERIMVTMGQQIHAGLGFSFETAHGHPTFMMVDVGTLTQWADQEKLTRNDEKLDSRAFKDFLTNDVWPHVPEQPVPLKTILPEDDQFRSFKSIPHIAPRQAGSAFQWN